MRLGRDTSEMSENTNQSVKVQEIKVNIDDTYMNIIKFGTGSKCLVTIAGLCFCDLEGQGNAIAEEYKAFSEKFTVYLIERKKVVAEGYSIPQMAEDTCRVLNELGIKKMYLYGVSQGGMISQCIAAYHPEMIEKLIICSSQCRTTKTAQGAIGEWIELAEKENVVDINRSIFEKVYSKAFLEKNKELLPILEKQGTPDDCKRFKILATACTNFDLYDDVAKIKCPTFVIGDEDDHVLGVEGTYEIIERLKCKSYIYEGYSHAIYDEAADIQDRILEFFEG